jgi:exonuclease SbcD
MKILHTSDWHIGHTLYTKKRYGEHEAFLSWLKETIISRGIDALIVAGDVFDTGAPGGQAQRLYYDFLTSLLGTCCRTVVVVAGNHDSPAMLEAPAGVLEKLHIHTIGLPGEIGRHVIPLIDAAGDVKAVCCAVPYLRKNEMVRLEDETQSTDEKIVAATAQFYRDVTDAALAYGVPIIATGHLFAQGAVRTDGDGVRELYVGTLGQVGADIFPEEIGYVALGHIHGAQVVGGQERIRYCGSPLPMSFSELGRDKCVLDVTLGEALSVQALSVPVFQRMTAVSGSREEILEKLQTLAGENVWIEVTYTGAEPCPHLSADVAEAVRGGCAEALSIRNTAAAGAMLDATDESISLASMSVQDVFLRCIGADALGEDDVSELVNCFNEIIREMEEAETCA